jgi:acetyltransferase-like isoleucine patch superfamily enzyme
VIEQARVSRGITLGEGVWLGAGAKILDGVAIGDHAIVGSGAVVREAVAAGDIVAGVPARVVGTRDGRAARGGTQG